VKHGEVIRFVSNGREFAWYFDGVAQPRPFDLTQIAPAGFVGHSVTVYVSLSERDFPAAEPPPGTESGELGNKTAAAPVLEVTAGIGPASYFIYTGDRNAAIH